jgi:hypothetical protein
MSAVVASLVFVLAATLAVSAITISWRTYGPALLAARRQLADCPTRRDIRFTVIEMKVACLARPAVRSLRPVLSARPELRAAA